MSESIHELFPGDLVTIATGAHVIVCESLKIRQGGAPWGTRAAIGEASGPCMIVSALPVRELGGRLIAQRCYAIDHTMMGWIHLNVKDDNRSTKMIERPEP